MTKVIKQNDKYLIFETFTRDLDVFVQVDQTSYIHLATEFLDINDAAEFIRLAKVSGYDTTTYNVIDKDQHLKAEQELKDKEENIKLKNTWDSLEDEGKRAMLTAIPEKDRKSFLEKVEDTSGIQPFTKEEVAERRIQRLEKTLGIEFTEEQKQILRTKED